MAVRYVCHGILKMCICCKLTSAILFVIYFLKMYLHPPVIRGEGEPKVFSPYKLTSKQCGIKASLGVISHTNRDSDYRAAIKVLQCWFCKVTETLRFLSF